MLVSRASRSAGALAQEQQTTEIEPRPIADRIGRCKRADSIETRKIPLAIPSMSLIPLATTDMTTSQAAPVAVMLDHLPCQRPICAPAV